MSFVPQRYVRKVVDMDSAVEISSEAFEKWGRSPVRHLRNGSDPSMFLSDHVVHNLFLFHQQDFRRELLVESSTVAEKWGTDDIAVNLSGMQPSLLREWLRAAANFCGALYLVDLSRLTKEDEEFWWTDLLASHAPPRTLFVMYYCPVGNLTLVLKNNRRIENLALFQVGLGNVSLFHGVSLRSLHLVDVGMDRVQLEALCNLDSPLVTHSLAIDKRRIYVDELEIRHPDLPWVESIAKILQWPLTQLTMIGFNASHHHLIELIHKCSDSSLQSMVCDLTRHSYLPGKATLIRSLVDALDHSGLPYLDLINLRDAAIEAQLSTNQRRFALKLSSLKKEPANAARLFICGDAYAGKTTLTSTLSCVCSQGPMLKKKALTRMRRVKSFLKQHGRTRGIEVRTIMKDGIRLSAWDMAGQIEFHAFHDHMIPDPSTNLGVSAMFLFVWSPIDNSKSLKEGRYKNEQDFEASFCYWLKFISSKTRQSNILRQMVVVLTHKDQSSHMQYAFADSVATLAARFHETIQVVNVMEVDSRKLASVAPLASCIFETARDVLQGAEVYSACSDMSKFLSLRNAKKPLVRDPIISWDDFGKLCNDKLNVSDLEVQKAIAYSLNESGDLIYLSNLPYLVLDPHWFCHEVMGDLIYFRHLDTFRGYVPKDGYFKQSYLEKILETITRDKVKGSLLVDLMEAMNLCCKVPDDTGGVVFIPAMLGEVSISERQLRWRGASSASTQEYTYVGRRLECDRKDSTFLTLGLFPMIQVAFRKAFLESKADVKNGKGFMSICVEDMEIIVEFSLANAQHVIDVMVRAPDWGDGLNTLAFVDKIVKTLIRLCAQREGNQGVRLLVGVIRPDCLLDPAPAPVREDQSVLILDLKQDLMKKLEKGERQEKLVHLWLCNKLLGPLTNHLIDLLGFEEFMEVFKSYKASLENASLLISTGQGDSESGEASTSSLHAGRSSYLISDDSCMQEGDGVTNQDLHEEGRSVESLCKFIVSVDKRLGNIQNSINSTREETSRKLEAIHGSLMEQRNDVLPKIQRLVEQSLKFSIESAAVRVPRLGILTTEKVGVSRRLVTAVFKDLKSVHIELFCEHRGGAHPVEGQKGLDVTLVEEGSSLKKALPYVNGFLKVLTVLAKIGAHAAAGLSGSAVPDLSKICAFVLDTAGSLDHQGLQLGVTLATSSQGETFSAWQQWLVSVLERKGGATDDNIASKFRLRRALYQDISQVAWLCDSHYKQQRPLPLA